MTNPVLYILVNELLPSMNVGKAMAHAAHASNQFTADFNAMIADEDPASVRLFDAYYEWTGQGSGFGTTIVLDIKSGEDVFYSSSSGVLASIMEGPFINSHDVIGSFIRDFTYPFQVPYEYAQFMPSIKFDRTISYAPSQIINATREEVTAAYIFLDKENVTTSGGRRAMKQLATYNLR